MGPLDSARRESRGLIAVVFHEAELGGASRAFLNVLPYMEERGWAFAFWVPGPGPLHDRLREDGRDVTAVERPLRYSWRSLQEPPGPWRRLRTTPRYAMRLRAWLAARRLVLLHANSLVAVLELVLAQGRAPVRLLHVHEPPAPGLRGWAATRLARRADLVVACSATSGRDLAAQGLHVRVVPNGIRVPPPGPPRDGAEPVVCTVGTVCHRKGSDVFVGVGAATRAKGATGVRFRMVGPPAPGRERAWAQRVIRAAEDQGIRCGESDDVQGELADSDVFVLPTRADNSPLAVLEAMAAGLPVVATAVGAIPEQVTPDTGILIDRPDPDAFSEAVLGLLRDPDRRAAMGRAGRERVLERFTIEHQAASLHDAYVAALSGRGT